MQNNNNSLPEATGKITVAEAVELTSNWRTYLENNDLELQTRSFLISINSITNLLAENPDAEGVRMYLGLKDAEDPNSGKVVLVAVVNGDDVIYVPGSNGDPDSVDDSNVYDRTSTCPPDCPPGNALNP